jgi:DNA-binding response OmpR family regulator
MSVLQFGEFELDEQTFELRRNGMMFRVQQQPARVLAFLISHQGKPVTRQQIQGAIWGQDTFVDFEQSLNFCIRQMFDRIQKSLFLVAGYTATCRMPRAFDRVDE